MANTYLFRINCDEYREPLVAEIERGRLRQGWGMYRVGEPRMTIEQDEASFIDAWKAYWNGDDEAYLRRKYTNLRIMLEMAEGDIIVVPKTADQRFSVLQVAGRYAFDEQDRVFGGTEWATDDFRHVIPVRVIAHVHYDHSAESRTVKQKFRVYQSAINRAYNEAFVEAVREIAEHPEENHLKAEATLASLRFWNHQPFDALADHIKGIIVRWSPHDFERIIVELFTKAGFEVDRMHDYDRLGGDIDITFRARNDLLSDILTLTSARDVALPTVRVQAKKKQGVDLNPMEGVHQLAQMMGKGEDDRNVLHLLINTTSAFDQATVDLAAQKNVVLLDGRRFAKLLLKYGIMEQSVAD